MQLLVGDRSHTRNIGICRHRNAHKYIPSIRLDRPLVNAIDNVIQILKLINDSVFYGRSREFVE